MIDIRCSREGIKCDGCPIMDKCEHIEVTGEIDPYAIYQQGREDATKDMDLTIAYAKGRADRTKEFQKQFDVMYADKMEQVRAEERARVLDELFNLNCKDIPQDECDAYCPNCYHCQFDRIKKKSERLKEQNDKD